MKKLYIYLISEEEFENTEYRPCNVETEEIITEDDWNYGDVLGNYGLGMEYEIVVDAYDLYVWKITRNPELEDEKEVQYVVELKECGDCQLDDADVR